jgi:hypothetical protein
MYTQRPRCAPTGMRPGCSGQGGLADAGIAALRERLTGPN